jgi:ribonuclease G
MHNEILVNANDGETRVAILERGQFVELHVERTSLRSVVGNVVKGRVSRVLPGMQAAFVDIGLEKAAFLYAGDYVEDIERLESDEEEDDAPRARRNRRGANGRRAVTDIGAILQEGQEILVQVAKEPIGTKGARITSHVSIAGRHLVLTPWSQRVGVSRRIDSDRERRRLREIVDRVRPRDLGFITRTAGEGTREADLEADVRYLTAVWDDIQIRKDQVRAPAILYSEPSLPLRVVRDFANSDTRRILVDSRIAFEEMKTFVERFMAEPRPRLDFHDGALPLFDAFGVERQVDANLGRKVWLKSGGYLIIDQSEALTAIDVNTGRYVGKRDLEETVLRTNLEAVKEVVQQLRFRNIGGLIIIDLIDMETAENREKVYRALQEAIRHDKAKTNILTSSAGWR